MARQLTAGRVTSPVPRRPGPGGLASSTEPAPAARVAPDARAGEPAAVVRAEARARPATARPRTGRSGAGAQSADESQRLGDKLREDWETIKRESRAAGEHLRQVFRRFKETLGPQ
jgi:hypothetical protein